MTIRDRINAIPELNQALANKDLDALTAGLNAQAPLEIAERWVNARTILNECVSGKSIIRKIKATTALDAVVEVAWAFLLTDQGLNIGANSTRESVDDLVNAGALSSHEGDELKALALQPTLVTRTEVETALFNQDGTDK